MARDFGGNTRATRDASAYSGLVLTVIGAPGSYFVHVRTADTLAPWQYYRAPLPVTSEWTDVTIEWAAFAPQSLRLKLDINRLMRVGIVAAQRAFEADVAVARLSFASLG